MMFVGISIPVTKSIVVNNSTNNNSGPILEITIFTSRFDLFEIAFNVRNIGNATVHNVTYLGIHIAGNVIYNSRADLMIDELEPGNAVFGWSDRFIGFGIFTANITITCDEGYIATASVNGIVFGPFYYIP
jgi:hypothetical protein